MSEKPNGKGSIVSLDEVRATRSPMKKGADLATRQDVADMIAAECAKVHEYYLNQIPPFCARMIQDALISFGLLQVAPGPDHPDGAQLQAVPAMATTQPEITADHVATVREEHEDSIAADALPDVIA